MASEVAVRLACGADELAVDMSRGVTVKSAENVALAQQLRAEGLTYREIGERFGVNVHTASDWVNDPAGRQLRARKDRHAKPCVDCGTQTSGGEVRTEEPRCHPCAVVKSGAEAKVWTRSAIILAIGEWAAQYGEPPAVPDWSPFAARHQLHDEERAQRCERAKAAGEHPSYQTVIREFGSWNAAIEAAGFTPRAVGGWAANTARRRSMRAKAAA